MDTNHWTVDEVGIYQRLLLTEWVNGGLPNDEKRLARIAGCSHKKFQKGWTIIKIKFDLNGANLYVNKRMEEVREEQRNFKELQAVKGKKSAEKRWKDHITTVTNRLQPKGNSSSSSSSSSSLKHKTYSEGFSKFWNEYPNKKAKPNAYKEWNKFKPELEIVLTALQRQKEHKESLVAQGKFCPEWPHPERWIKNQRWLDEIESEPLDSTDRMIYEMKKERDKK